MPSLEIAERTEQASWETTAMACHIGIQASREWAPEAARALAVFRDVERVCTRFDPESPLMRCNAEPDRWHRAPRVLGRALRAAQRAHALTGGLFDPRVHDALVALGYDRSFHLGPGDGTGGQAPGTPASHGPWQPRFVPPVGLVHLGGARIDLGGIGKGLALRWARDRLGRRCGDFLIAAGGDVVAAGGPGGEGAWRVGVEDPRGGPEPLAVLELRDLAVATSSVRVRRWTHAGRPVHHLIDPKSGRPGGAGLMAVTVCHPDPAWAEVWSKSLFLAGPARLAAVATRRALPVLWVDDRGAVRFNRRMNELAIWKAT